jgi:7-cyano-7-deazaguanine reductase
MNDNSYGLKAISEAKDNILETWPNPAPNNSYNIRIEHPEYTALCPRSGYPDFGCIVLDYVPKDTIVELKAYKLYINSFRDFRISHEEVVNIIADKIYQEVKPHGLRLIGDFYRRGNIKTVITTYRGEKTEFSNYTQLP